MHHWWWFLKYIFSNNFFFMTYLFYLTTLGFLKMDNKEIMTEVQSHSTPLVLHGPVVTFTQRTIQLIHAFLTITLEKHQLSWQPIYFNEFPKWELTRAFTVGRNTVSWYLFLFFSYDTNIVVTSVNKKESTTKQKSTCRTALENLTANKNIKCYWPSAEKHLVTSSSMIA